MLNVLIKGIFWIITKLADLLLSPFIIAITALFPEVSQLFRYVNYFLSACLTYVPFLLDFLLIPRGAIILLFDYFSIKYSIYLLKTGINFALNIYYKLKP